MSLLYTVTSVCSVLMVEMGYLEGSGVLYDGWEPEFGISPTILYCTLITVTIIPFSFFRPELLERINTAHKFMILGLALFVVIQGVTVLSIVGGAISDIINGDFLALKNARYADEISPTEAKMLSMPLPFQILYFTNHIAFFGMPLFFYYTCIEKRCIWYTWLLLLSSASPVIRGMIEADRTEIIHFGLMFILSLCIFQKVLTKRIKVFLSLSCLPVMLIGIIYIMAVSASRFEKTDEGAGGSMLQYAGQSYANFCFFYDNHNSNLYYLERELPITHFLLFKSQYTDTKEERSAKEGFFIGVFATHIGSWLLDIGIGGAVFFSFLFSFLALFVIRYYNRRKYNIEELLLLFILAVIPVFGIFYYRFYHIAIAIQYFVAIVLYLFSKIRIVWNEEKNIEEI